MLAVDQVDAKIVKDLVHLVHDVRVGHHLAGIQAHKVVFSHVIGQISQNQSPLLGFVDGRGVDLDVVALSVHINLLTVVVDDLCGRNDSAITHAEVEECQEVVHILCRQEVGHLQGKVEPPGYTDLRVSARYAAILWNVFLHLHVDLVGVRVKVEHYRLLSETILVMDLGCNLVKVLVNRLLDIQRIALDPVYMPFDISQSNHPLLDLPVRPDRLDAVGSSLLDDLINWQLCSALSPLVCLEGILDCSNSSHSLQKPLEEENHLLVFVNVDGAIVVKDREANCDGDVQPGRLEDQEVFVLVLEHKLIDEWILLEALECLL